jgi:hypothetical protein
MITLNEATKTGKIDDFISQEEARGVGPVDRAEFDGAVANVIKERRSVDQTLRSASAGNSSGKKTRRGSGPDASR